MTKYEACKWLKSQGCPLPDEYPECDWIDGADGKMPAYSLNQVLSFAESLAEGRWKGGWYRELRNTPNYPNNKFMAMILNDETGVFLDVGSSDINDWWAVFNLIKAMKGA